MESESTSLDLDETDLRILGQLQKDASLSNQDLAAVVHVSPATCLRRVRRLVDEGVIVRRVALLDPARLGGEMTVIAEVTLDRQGVEHLKTFQERAVAHAAIRHCYRVSPGPDFVLIASVGAMPAWAQVVDELFTHDANVRNIKAYFVVEVAKRDTAVDLSRARDQG